MFELLLKPIVSKEEILHKLADTPDEFLCPITSDPVFAEDYDRKPIQTWLAKQATSPIVHEKISKNLIPNKKLKSDIEREYSTFKRHNT